MSHDKRARKVIAYDVRADGIDYRVCTKCVHRREFGGAIAEPVHQIEKGDMEFCEICDKVLHA